LVTFLFAVEIVLVGEFNSIKSWSASDLVIVLCVWRALVLMWLELNITLADGLILILPPVGLLFESKLDAEV